jgi:hypothetical protein
VAALAVLLGGLCAVALILVVARSLLRDTTPELTAATLATAEQSWTVHGPASYDLDVQISGIRSGEVHLEVRNGKVTSMTRDGRSPAQHRTWDAWTVPNQFEMLQTELDAAADPTHGFGAPQGTQVVQRASFDPRLGYPLVYERFVLGQPQLDLAWRVTRFAGRAD